MPFFIFTFSSTSKSNSYFKRSYNVLNSEVCFVVWWDAFFVFFQTSFEVAIFSVQFWKSRMVQQKCENFVNTVLLFTSLGTWSYMKWKMTFTLLANFQNISTYLICAENAFRMIQCNCNGDLSPSWCKLLFLMIFPFLFNLLQQELYHKLSNKNALKEMKLWL